VNKIEFGDCRDTMRRWASEGVKAQMCVTSPPYFGLRDYGHDGQIGLEQTPEQYIAAMVDVFRCVRDVLADDGTLWLNIGDSYATSNPVGRRDTNAGQLREGRSTPNGSYSVNSRKSLALADKQLIGIPWRVALALQADGWWLRQDIVWHKTNPMPESAKDRCTRSHEFIFLMSKRPSYYFNAEAIREESAESSKARAHISRKPSPKHAALNSIENRAANMDVGSYGQGRNKRDVWSVSVRPYKGAHFATFPPALIEPCILAGSRPGDIVLDPFMGSGTTAMVALQHDRQYLGCELNSDYAALQQERIASVIKEDDPQMDLLDFLTED
jgi:DNA modification methylase